MSCIGTPAACREAVVVGFLGDGSCAHTARPGDVVHGRADQAKVVVHVRQRAGVPIGQRHPQHLLAQLRHIAPLSRSIRAKRDVSSANCPLIVSTLVSSPIAALPVRLSLSMRYERNPIRTSPMSRFCLSGSRSAASRGPSHSRHRWAAAIDQRKTGYRNFNAFLNRYRIDEANAALSDLSR
jgi:hypothetical protein